MKGWSVIPELLALLKVGVQLDCVWVAPCVLPAYTDVMRGLWSQPSTDLGSSSWVLMLSVCRCKRWRTRGAFVQHTLADGC